MKKNLIITPTGKESLYVNWLGPNDNFDIIFLCYEDNNFHVELKNKGFNSFKVKGEKWGIIKTFLNDNGEFLKNYDLFWFPDDDLNIDSESINKLFDLHKKYDIYLSQPSVFGHTSHIITNKKNDTILRYTNFVEVMCPMMSKDCLLSLLNTFDYSESGWGLDLLWPKILNYPEDKIAIIDDVEIEHTKPVGSNYKNRFSKEPQEELNFLMEKYNLNFNLTEYKLIKNDFIKKIDVCVNVFGKPYQTLITLKTLLNHSGYLIDKIYFIEEQEQPIDYDYKIIEENLKYDKLIKFIPQHYLFTDRSDTHRSITDQDYRLSLRYQYGLENTDKKHLLIIHNDVLFTGDIVSELLSEIGDSFTIGNIGQCWNCPLKFEHICDSHLLESNCEKQLPYNEIINLINKYPKTRTSTIGRTLIDKNKPFPMPECRVNEWCALINIDDYKKEVIPNGDVVPFGGYYGLDIGDVWFRQMVNKGYKYKNYNIYKSSTHAYFSEVNNGHSAMNNRSTYNEEEQRAKDYFNKHNL